ncbi:MAG: glycosyltransferase family 4 protein [Paracoccaceae bacterium]
MIQTVIHLVDDTSPGGVTRVLDHIAKSTALGHRHRHEIRTLRRGRLGAPKLGADLIVSHLSVSWANLPMLTALRALNPAARIIHVEHSYTEAFVASHVVARGRFQVLMRVAYALFDQVVAVSRPQADWIARAGFAPEEHVVVINPMVDLGPFLALEPRLEAAPRVFGLIGRLDVQKGFDIAIRAFREAAPGDATLLVAGEGPERAALEALAAGDQRIRFMGWAERPEVAMAACDAVLMPSRWEAFGLVALEAQAAGRLVAVAQTDGMAEHVRRGAFGVGQNAIAGWADAIRILCRSAHAERILAARFRARATQAKFEHDWLGMLEGATDATRRIAAAA